MCAGPPTMVWVDSGCQVPSLTPETGTFQGHTLPWSLVIYGDWGSGTPIIESPKCELGPLQGALVTER